eukprot:TRINITY_DN26082_c0_g1_i1.p1 TRINITY_DN26082_c0_g1~~TRINITY_DN26082_c0_g1_i1.p1  ORF type:complete len:115 (+),score=24.39 TRINITY_DN26082_c0_g1_i1:29-346(+)
MSEEKESLKAKWIKLLEKAVEADAWGQVVEAREFYNKIVVSIDGEQEEDGYSREEKSTLIKLRGCIAGRSKGLKNNTKGITLEEIKELLPLIQDLFTSKAIKPPA